MAFPPSHHRILREEMFNILKDYFDKRNDIAFAFLFGSASRRQVRKDGDVDIAVYFWPEKDVEWELFNKRYSAENTISLELERMLKKEVDLIVLNRARSVLADEILRKGKPIVIKDKGILMDFLCIVTDEAEYVRNWLGTSYRERRIEAIR